MADIEEILAQKVTLKGSYRQAYLSPKTVKELAHQILAVARQERLDRPELREKFARVLHKMIRQFEVEKCPEAFDMRVHIDQILIHIQDEEETREQLDALKIEIADLNKKLDDREADLIEAKREERKSIIAYLDQANDTRDLDKRLQELRSI